MYDPLGLSIGTTNLVAVSSGSTPVTRRAVLTLYPHCAPKIGVPGEHPPLNEPGMLLSGFVERIGDSVALVSGDGSAHDPDLLMVEALDAMVLAAGADVASSETGASHLTRVIRGIDAHRPGGDSVASMSDACLEDDPRAQCGNARLE